MVVDIEQGLQILNEHVVCDAVAVVGLDEQSAVIAEDESIGLSGDVEVLVEDLWECHVGGSFPCVVWTAVGWSLPVRVLYTLWLFPVVNRAL